MKRAINKNKVQLGFIILMSLALLSAFGCKEAPSLVEFLEMHPADADLLDAGARYQVIQEILWLIDDPAGDSGMRLLDITFGDQDPQAEYPGTAHGGIALISVRLAERLEDMKGIKTAESLMAPGSIIDMKEIPIPEIDETAAEKVRLTFDFDSGENPWGSDSMEGLYGYSEIELLGILAEFAAPTIQTALARYMDATEISIRVVRAEGAPFLASYDQAGGELALNPNYLHLVSLLPPGIFAMFAENSTDGPKHFSLCLEYIWNKLLSFAYESSFVAELCEELGILGFLFYLPISVFISIIASILYVLFLPVHVSECFHFLFECGTLASSAAGTLPLAGLILVPLVFFKIAGRMKKQRPHMRQSWKGWTAKVKTSRLGQLFLYSIFLVTFVIVVLCAIFLGSADAWAESDTQDIHISKLLRDEKDFGINAVFGGPAIIAGLQLGFNPHARIGLDVGVGISAAPTVYLESKYYFMSKNFTPYAGLGAAYWAIPFFGYPISSAYVYPTLGIQYMFDSGLSLSLHGEAFVHISGEDVFPYGGLTIGWYF